MEQNTHEPQEQITARNKKKERIVLIFCGTFLLFLITLIAIPMLTPHKHQNDGLDQFFYERDKNQTQSNYHGDKATVILYNVFYLWETPGTTHVPFHFKAEGPEKIEADIEPSMAENIQSANKSVYHLTPGTYHLIISAGKDKKCLEYELKAGKEYVIVQTAVEQ
jgi:hypothetical protein